MSRDRLEEEEEEEGRRLLVPWGGNLIACMATPLIIPKDGSFFEHIHFSLYVSKGCFGCPTLDCYVKVEMSWEENEGRVEDLSLVIF